MNNVTLSNILVSIAPGEGFGIYGTVETESDYTDNVKYNDSSKKPTWSEVQSGQDPEQWVVVRARRSGKLLSCDWTVLSDVPITAEKKAEWETYRQSLRDITDQSDPFNITWPTQPTE